MRVLLKYYASSLLGSVSVENRQMNHLLIQRRFLSAASFFKFSLLAYDQTTLPNPKDSKSFF